jgi:hypothetical protein
VMTVKSSCGDAVRNADGQRHEAVGVNLLLKVVRRGQFPQRLLNGNLPRADSRDRDEVGGVRDRVPSQTDGFTA